MRKVIIGILMSFCLFGMYQSLWANHSMHPLKQIAFVKKMIGRRIEVVFIWNMIKPHFLSVLIVR